MKLPPQLIATITHTWGPKGGAWLATLDDRIATLSERWQLSDIRLMPDLSYHVVAEAQSALYGSVILKCGVDTELLTREAAALKVYNGIGAVHLKAFDPDTAALLLERLEPGRSLTTLFPQQDERATQIAVKIMIKLMVPADELDIKEFIALKEWYAALFDDSTELPLDALTKARRFAREQCESDQKLYLAHGDLHHANILESEHGWLAIDPVGVLAPKGFDVGAFMRNPFKGLLETSQIHAYIGSRFDQCADLLSLDRTELVHMSYAQAVLAACWAIHDNSPDWKKWLEIAHLIESH